MYGARVRGGRHERLARAAHAAGLLRCLEAAAMRDMAAFVRGLEDACGMQMPETSLTRLFVNWDEAADMTRLCSACLSGWM